MAGPRHSNEAETPDSEVQRVCLARSFGKTNYSNDCKIWGASKGIAHEITNGEIVKVKHSIKLSKDLSTACTVEVLMSAAIETMAQREELMATLTRRVVKQTVVHLVFSLTDAFPPCGYGLACRD